MRSFVRLFAFIALCAPLAYGQTKVEAKDLATHPFSADFPSGGQIRMHLRSGEIHILGTEADKITVQLAGKNAPNARDLKVRLERSSSGADLRIRGGHRNDLILTVGVPKASDLFVRIPAGEVHVEGVTGNKDVHLHAGELVIAVGNAADYAQVDASVHIGEVDWSAAGQSKGGFFRSFHQQGTGKYRLHAHVGAGDLTLR